MLAPGQQPPAKFAETLVRVTVENEEEDGEASINWRQPQVNQVLTASASDPDTRDAQGDPVSFTFTWQWSVPKVNRPEPDKDAHWTPAGAQTTDQAAYTPAADDVGKLLRAKASYADGHGTGKAVYVLSEFPVRAEPAANSPPMFDNTALATRDVDENAARGALVGAPVTATDSNSDDSDVLTYTIPETTPGNPFAIDKKTGQIMVDGAVHHEVVGGNGGTYTVVVTATDPSGEADTFNVTITANDVNEKPTVTGSASETIAEIDSTPDDPGNYTYEAFTEDYTEADTDEGDETTFSVGGDDASAFDISTTGELTFKSNPDFESPADVNQDNLYRVSVVATDKAGLPGMVDVSIEVTNVVEDGSVSLSTIQPAAGMPITATLDDPDTGETGMKWQWQSSGTGAVDSFVDIDGATSATYTPKAAVKDNPATVDVDEADPGDEGDFLRATVSYRDEASPKADNPDTGTTDESKDNTESAMADSESAVRARPEVNSAPEFESATMTRKVAENTKTGDNAGDPVKAEDADYDTLTYSRTGGADMDKFGIDDETGQITVGSAMLDYEGGTRSYEVEVTASDPFGKSDTTMVTIEVTDVNEKPTLGEGEEPGYAENGMGPVATYTAYDPEGQGIDWDVRGTDSALFSIDENGVLTFKDSPNYEDPKDVAHAADGDFEGDTEERCG